MTTKSQGQENGLGPPCMIIRMTPSRRAPHGACNSMSIADESQHLNVVHYDLVTDHHDSSRTVVVEKLACQFGAWFPARVYDWSRSGAVC